MNLRTHLEVNSGIKIPLGDLCLIDRMEGTIVLDEELSAEDLAFAREVIADAASSLEYWFLATDEGTGGWMHYLVHGPSREEAIETCLRFLNGRPSLGADPTTSENFEAVMPARRVVLQDESALDPDPEPPVESTRKVRVEIVRGDQEVREFVLDFPVVSDMSEEEVTGRAWGEVRRFARETVWRQGEFEKGKLLRVVKGDHPDFFEIAEDEVLPEEEG